MVVVKYALTKEDYANYYTYMTWDSPANKKKRLRYYVRQLVPVILFAAAFYYTGLFRRPGNFILLIAGFLVLTTFLSLIGMRANTVKLAEKLSEDPENSSIFLEGTLTATDTGLVLKDEVSETRYNWRGIIKKLESANYYFLFTSGVQAIIVPKRVFQHSLQKAEFEKLLGQHLSLEADLSSHLS